MPTVWDVLRTRMLSFPILLSHVGGRSHVFVLDPGAGLCLSCLSKLFHSSTEWGRKKKHGCSIFAKECFLGLINNCRNFLSRSKLLTILSMFSAAKQNRSGDHAGVFQIIQGGGWWPHCEPVFMFSLIDFEIQWLPYGSTTYSTGVWSANWLLELCLLMYSLVFH